MIYQVGNFKVGKPLPAEASTQWAQKKKKTLWFFSTYQPTASAAPWSLLAQQGISLKCFNKMSCFALQMFQQKSCFAHKWNKSLALHPKWLSKSLVNVLHPKLWTKSCFAPKMVEQKFALHEKMSEQKSCFASKMFGKKSCLASKICEMHLKCLKISFVLLPGYIQYVPNIDALDSTHAGTVWHTEQYQHLQQTLYVDTFRPHACMPSHPGNARLGMEIRM